MVEGGEGGRKRRGRQTLRWKGSVDIYIYISPNGRGEHPSVGVMWPHPARDQEGGEEED